jgi:predicted phage-related endonuclease
VTAVDTDDIDVALTPTIALDHLNDRLARMAWIGSKIAELATEHDEIKASIQDEMGDAETATVNGRPVVRWTKHVRHSLDQKALKKNSPEVWNQFVTTSFVRRFTLVTEDET